MILGAILAGGKGSRMGGPKALMDVGGAPLIAYAARALRGGTARLAVVGDAAAAAVMKAAALDDPPGCARGPLAGVLAALIWAEAEGAAFVMIVACDTPLLPDDITQRLYAAMGPALAACVETPAGLEPLISLWRVEAAPALRAALGGGAHPPAHAFLDELGCARASLDDPAQAMNLNAPEDVASLLAHRAFRRLSDPPRA